MDRESMRKIDDRLSLSATAAPVFDFGPGRGSVAEAQPDVAALSAGQTAALAPGGSVVGVDGVTPLADAVHTTLVLPGIGLGYASLDGIEDKETAFVLTASGLTTITSGAHGYYVKSDNPMDAALSKIMGFDHASDGYADPSSAMSGLTTLNFTTGKVIDASRQWDINGTSSSDSIQAGSQSDLIHGLAGNDSINAGQGDDIAWGGIGNDLIFGDSGNDQLWGNAGNDTLDGGIGNDFLFGGSGTDTLLGGEGSDLLLGGTGNDSITGGDGDDVLVGGGGADTLTGSAGHDLFIFAEGDSGVGALNQDQVADFTIGEDRLDLTSFTQALHVVGAFDHHAYEMVLTDREDGTLIQIDLNGDGAVDQEIVVITTDHAHLTGSDYVI
jgi:hypothetical protein